MSLPHSFFIGKGGKVVFPFELMTGLQYMEDTGYSLKIALPSGTENNPQTVSDIASFYITKPSSIKSIKMGGGRGGPHLDNNIWGGRGTGITLTLSDAQKEQMEARSASRCYVGYGMGGHSYNNYPSSAKGGACSYLGYGVNSTDLIAVAAGAGGGPKYSGYYSEGQANWSYSDADWKDATTFLIHGHQGSPNDDYYSTGGGTSSEAGGAGQGYRSEGSAYSGYNTETIGGFLLGGHTNYDGGGGGGGFYGGGGGYDYSGSNGGSGGGGCSFVNDTFATVDSYYMAGSDIDGFAVAQNTKQPNYGWRCEIFYK